MTTILKPGIQKIMAVFYKEKNMRFHLRELARRTGLYGQSITRYLSQLEKEGFLASKKEGNMKLFEFRRKDMSYAVFAYFDIARLNELPSIRRNAISYFLQSLKEKPVISVLFGSTAKNTYKEDSDIDLLMAVNKRIDTKEAESYADSQTAIRISPIQIGLNELKEELKLKKDKVIQSAINTGYPITNHIEYYRMIYNEGI